MGVTLDFKFQTTWQLWQENSRTTSKPLYPPTKPTSKATSTTIALGHSRPTSIVSYHTRSLGHGTALPPPCMWLNNRLPDCWCGGLPPNGNSGWRHWMAAATWFSCVFFDGLHGWGVVLAKKGVIFCVMYLDILWTQTGCCIVPWLQSQPEGTALSLNKFG